MISSTAATPGEVANEMATAGGTAAAGGARLIVIALARFVTMAVSAVICCANLALDGALSAMFCLSMRDCLVLG